MSGYVWELPGPEARCDLHRPGHQVFWVQFNVSMREPLPIIPVTASVDDDGLVHITGEDVSLVMWNHRPDLVADALRRFGGMADWKPRWGLLAVPAATVIGGARSVFYLARPEQRSECGVANRAPGNAAPEPDDPVAPRDGRDQTRAEQEARNVALRRSDHSRIPPLRVAERYAGGPGNRRPARGRFQNSEGA